MWSVLVDFLLKAKHFFLACSETAEFQGSAVTFLLSVSEKAVASASVAEDQAASLDLSFKKTVEELEISRVISARLQAGILSIENELRALQFDVSLISSQENDEIAECQRGNKALLSLSENVQRLEELVLALGYRMVASLKDAERKDRLVVELFVHLESGLTDLERLNAAILSQSVVVGLDISQSHLAQIPHDIGAKLHETIAIELNVDFREVEVLWVKSASTALVKFKSHEKSLAGYLLAQELIAQAVNPAGRFRSTVAGLVVTGAAFYGLVTDCVWGWISSFVHTQLNLATVLTDNAKAQSSLVAVLLAQVDIAMDTTKVTQRDVDKVGQNISSVTLELLRQVKQLQVEMSALQNYVDNVQIELSEKDAMIQTQQGELCLLRDASARSITTMTAQLNQVHQDCSILQSEVLKYKIMAADIESILIQSDLCVCSAQAALNHLVPNIALKLTQIQEGTVMLTKLEIENQEKNLKMVQVNDQANILMSLVSEMNAFVQLTLSELHHLSKSNESLPVSVLLKFRTSSGSRNVIKKNIEEDIRSGLGISAEAFSLMCATEDEEAKVWIIFRGSQGENALKIAGEFVLQANDASSILRSIGACQHIAEAELLGSVFESIVWDVVRANSLALMQWNEIADACALAASQQRLALTQLLDDIGIAAASVQLVEEEVRALGKDGQQMSLALVVRAEELERALNISEELLQESNSRMDLCQNAMDKVCSLLGQLTKDVGKLQLDWRELEQELRIDIKSAYSMAVGLDHFDMLVMCLESTVNLAGNQSTSALFSYSALSRYKDQLIIGLTAKADTLLKMLGQCRALTCPLLEETEECKVLMSSLSSEWLDLERDRSLLLALPVVVSLTVDDAHKNDAVSAGGALEDSLGRDVEEALGIDPAAVSVNVLWIEEEGCALVMLAGVDGSCAVTALAQDLLLQAVDAGSRLRSTCMGFYVRGGECQGATAEGVWRLIAGAVLNSEMKGRWRISEFAACFQDGVFSILAQVSECFACTASLFEQESALAKQNIAESGEMSEMLEKLELSFDSTSSVLITAIQYVHVCLGASVQAHIGLRLMDNEIRRAQGDVLILKQMFLSDGLNVIQFHKKMVQADEHVETVELVLQGLSSCIFAQQQFQLSVNIPSNILAIDFFGLHDQMGSSKFKAWLESVKGKRGRPKNSGPVLIEFLRMLAALDDAHDAELQYNDALHALLSSESKKFDIGMVQKKDPAPCQSAQTDDGIRHQLNSLSNTSMKKRLELSDAVTSLYHSILYAEANQITVPARNRKNSLQSLPSQSPPPPPPRRDKTSPAPAKLSLLSRFNMTANKGTSPNSV